MTSLLSLRSLTNLISVRQRSKRERIKTITFYLRDISTLLVGVVIHRLTVLKWIQYTIEFENQNKQLNFLDVTITNTGNNSYDFKIFWETSITNVQIKPNSNIAPHIKMGVFKGFLSRAYKICTEKHLQSEIDILIDIFTENRHNRNTITNIGTEYL